MGGGNALVSINAVPVQGARLLLGWVSVCWLINHLCDPTTYVNSAFQPSGSVNRVPVRPPGVRQGKSTCVGWQVTLCDPMWQVTPCGSEMTCPGELYHLRVTWGHTID